MGYMLQTDVHTHPVLCSHYSAIADNESVELNESHAPRENAIEAFKRVEKKIKEEIIASRKRWDGHEERSVRSLPISA
jgi:hypothetical protein